MRRILITFIFISALAAPSLSSATDQNRPVLDVLIADVNGDLDGFLVLMKRIEGVAKRLGLPAKLRVFQATFAGDQNGEIHIYWELPSFIAFAEAETKLHSDAEFLEIVSKMDTAGQSYRSELLSIEITQ